MNNKKGRHFFLFDFCSVFRSQQVWVREWGGDEEEIYTPVYIYMFFEMEPVESLHRSTESSDGRGN